MILASLLVLLFLPAAQCGACVEIAGPQLSAVALSPFLVSPDPTPERLLADSPAPGHRRWISPAELRRWGLEPRSDLPPVGICVRRRLEALAAEAVAGAVRTALDARPGGATLLRVTSYQPAAAPPGQLLLPASGFRILAAAEDACTFLWNGFLEYDDHRTIPLQVLGRLQVPLTAFVARRGLQPGETLAAGDYERVTRPGCSTRLDPRPEDPAGSTMKVSLRIGEVIQPRMLSAPPVVAQGETVRVVARVGEAAVSIDAEAEREGRRGESIFVRNIESGKRIRVLLTGKKEASAIDARH